jgi:hypothetical protein
VPRVDIALIDSASKQRSMTIGGNHRVKKSLGMRPSGVPGAMSLDQYFVNVPQAYSENCDI